MIPWYLNPKNICLMVFGMMMLTMGAAFLWQRGTISDLRETHMRADTIIDGVISRKNNGL